MNSGLSVTVTTPLQIVLHAHAVASLRGEDASGISVSCPAIPIS